MTQGELGEKLALGKTSITNYESGYSIPAARILEKIAAVFDMTFADFVMLDDSINQNKDIDISDPKGAQPVNNMIIRVDSCFINGIDKAAPFYEQLKKAIDYNVECQEEEQKARWEEEQAAWEREEQRYYANEGYWDAFDGDPEAYWNID